ncbi:hypothetical protein HAALTHF_11910n [Vreelandella aquamarina]|nr:hypothetical protein HAALTHF_11910n [Halomonas axialensis]
MSERITRHRLQVAADLDRFINEQALPGTGVDESAFWAGVDALFHDLTPKTANCLKSATRCKRSWTLGTVKTPARSATCPPTAAS